MGRGFCGVCLLWLLCGLALALAPPPARAESQGYALIVGVDAYEDRDPRLPDLMFAERDARALARYFASQDYEVRLLLGSAGNADRDTLFETVAALARRIDGDDRFVFSFSGHGVTEERDGVTLGYLVTHGPPGTVARLSAGDLHDIGASLDVARHQLFIIASCYGGLLGQLPRRSAAGGTSARDLMVADLRDRRARQFLSAGGGDQEVLDSGPAGLSWFTFFLLKGLEPGVVNQRADGVVTFSEWASYVQAWSANPFHTPAFGTLAGHGGGQFLLETTDRAEPPLETLPDVAPEVLDDLGFLAGPQRDEVAHSVEDMRAPIDRLYQAWEALDLGLYMDQFHPDVVQTGRYRGGRAWRRGYDEIEARRRDLFPRLARVDVVNYEVMFQGAEDDTAHFAVTYSMDFHFRNGRVIREHAMKECYRVVETPDGAWRIRENNDYLNRLCSRP